MRSTIFTTVVLGIILSMVAIILLAIIITFTGFHYETSRGEHTGYISATEKSGVFFKTGRAYLKTDTQSSQEDQYCVMDDSVLARLREASEKKTHINVKFLSYIAAGVKNCHGEDAIIYDVTEIK